MLAQPYTDTRSTMRYFHKMKGTGPSPARCCPVETFWSFIGGFIGVALIAWLAERASPADGFLLIGSFGATAVLAYAAPQAPLSQPRNIVGGHVLSALIGVTTYQLLGHIPWLAAAVAVSMAIATMHVTSTLHPPGGATALIAVTGSPAIHEMGYRYALTPVAEGAVILLVVALIINNIPKTRRYPLHWW